MSRESNVLVFEDTRKLVKSNKKLVENTKLVIALQKVYLEDDALPTVEKDIYQQAAKVIVSQKRSFEAAMRYVGSNVAVLNFASANNPGGGVTKGSSAQEEALCRCSNLYFALIDGKVFQKFYLNHRLYGNPLHNDDIIYSPGVTVFKSDTANPSLLPENQWKNVDVITCAAPNLRPKPSNRMNPNEGAFVKVSDANLQSLHEKRLRRILDVSVLNGVDTIILGAFGCGAFQNSPTVVASAAKNVIADYLYAFKDIEFAIYCGPRGESNYKTFKEILQSETNARWAIE